MKNSWLNKVVVLFCTMLITAEVKVRGRHWFKADFMISSRHLQMSIKDKLDIQDRNKHVFFIYILKNKAFYCWSAFWKGLVKPCWGFFLSFNKFWPMFFKAWNILFHFKFRENRNQDISWIIKGFSSLWY